MADDPNLATLLTRFIHAFSRNSGLSQKKLSTALEKTFLELGNSSSSPISNDATNSVKSPQFCCQILAGYGPRYGQQCGKNATKQYEDNYYCNMHYNRLMITSAKKTQATPKSTQSQIIKSKERIQIEKGVNGYVVGSTTLTVNPDLKKFVGKSDDTDINEEDKKVIQKTNCDLLPEDEEDDVIDDKEVDDKESDDEDIKSLIGTDITEIEV